METWQHVDVRTRAYLLVEGPPAPQRARLALWGFHGYAEHPRTAVQALRGCCVRDGLLVAPMGQHHLYNRAGEVVASWMTRHERDDQVRQIIDYLETAAAMLREAHGAPPIVAVGFSQGAAAAYRMAALSRLPVAHLHVLAGEMPPEVATALVQRPPVPVTLHWGTEDHRVPRAILERDLERLREAGWLADLQDHPGGHGWLAGAIRSISESLAQIVPDQK